MLTEDLKNMISEVMKETGMNREEMAGSLGRTGSWLDKFLRNGDAIRINEEFENNLEKFGYKIVLTKGYDFAAEWEEACRRINPEKWEDR